MTSDNYDQTESCPPAEQLIGGILTAEHKARFNAAIASGWTFHPSKDVGGTARPEYWEKDGQEIYADYPPTP